MDSNLADGLDCPLVASVSSCGDLLSFADQSHERDGEGDGERGFLIRLPSGARIVSRLVGVCVVLLVPTCLPRVLRFPRVVRHL